MNLTLREVRTADSEEILGLTLQLGYKSNLSETKNRIAEIIQNETHCAYVAIEDEKVRGWIHGFYTLRLHSDPFVEIGGLVVDEDFRGKGIGKKLVDKVKAWSLSKSITKLRVRCNIKRSDSHHFYRALKFKEVKEQKIFDQSLL